MRAFALTIGRFTAGTLLLALMASCKSGDSPAAAHVASVAVEPASPVIFVGATAQLSATLRDASGNVLTSRTVTWTSSNPIIATVSATGLVSALQEGTVVVSATSETVEGHTTVTLRTPVATVTLNRTAVSIGVGTDFAFAAEVRSADGTVLTGRAITWSSSAPAVATVSPFGVVTALSAGTTTITATVESRVATATVTVGAAVASIVITPPTLAIGAGLSATLVATPRDAQGNALANRVQTWSTSNGAVANVSGTGVVTAIAVGNADVMVRIEGQTATVPVTVRAADVAIDAAQLTQAAQDATGTIPMVSGRAAVLTVVVSSRATQTVPVELVLRLLNAGNSVVYSDTIRRTMQTGPAASLETSTAQFLIPSAQLRTGLRWQVERDPRHLAPDDSLANDLYPRGAAASFTVVDAPPLLLKFVPIQLAAHGNATGNVTSNNMEAYLYMVRRLLPVSVINASVAPPFTTNANFGTPPNGGAEAFWTQVLQELDLARVASGDVPTTHWYGIMVPPAGFTFTAYGGFGYIPFSGTATGAGTRTALSVQLGWFNSANLARDNIAHEIGHNFGRRHAPCGGAGNPDPAFPVAGGFTGAVGFDVYGWASGSALLAASQPSSDGDIMGYCAPVWISPYTYGGMLTFRGTVVSALTGAATAAPRAAAAAYTREFTRENTQAYTRAFVVRGQVARGVLALEPSFTTEVLVEPASTGTNRVELLDADGHVVVSQPFTPAQLDHSDQVQLFTVPVAISPAEESQVTALRVSGPEGRILRNWSPSVQAAMRASTEKSSGAGAARVSAVRVAAGLGANTGARAQWRITCPSPAAAGAMVRDGATGALLGVARGAYVTVSATSGRTLTLMCSDGVRQQEFTVTTR